MDVQADDPRTNGLLATLDDDVWARIEPHLELTPMPLGLVLYESGSQLQHVYFPTSAIVSLLYVMEDGHSAEIAIVGMEGMVGVALFMGGETTPSRAIVQSAGSAYRLAGRYIKAVGSPRIRSLERVVGPGNAGVVAHC